MIEKIIRKINLSQGKKNVARISSGTILGQVVSFITLPILTRIYGAEIIGTWTLLQSIATIINSISDLGLTNSIMIEANEKYMLNVYKVISTLVLGVSIISGLFIFAYYSIKNSPSNLNPLFIGIFMVVTIFTLQQIQVCYTWLNRKGKYNILMKNPIINNITYGIIAIVLGLFGFKLYGYFVGWILGQIVTLIHMRSNLPSEIFTIKANDFKEVFTKSYKFVKYQLPTNIISNIKNQLPTLCIKTLFGTEILGYYSVTVRLLQIPITFLASAMGRVFFQQASEKKRRGEEIGEFVYNNMTKVMKIAVIPMIGILVAGDLFVKIFLGSEWGIAGILMRILSFQNFFMFLMLTVQGIGIILDKQNYNMISCIAQCIGIFLGLFIGKFVFNSIYIGILLMTISFIIINVTYFCLLFKYMRISVKKYLMHVIFYMLVMGVTSLVLRVILYEIGIIT